METDAAMYAAFKGTLEKAERESPLGAAAGEGTSARAGAAPSLRRLSARHHAVLESTVWVS